VCRTAEQCATSPARQQSVTEHFVTQLKNASLCRTSNIIRRRCDSASANSASRHKCQDVETKGKEGKGKERKNIHIAPFQYSIQTIQSAQTRITQFYLQITPCHPSAAGRAQDSKVRRPKTDVIPLCHATTLAGLAGQERRGEERKGKERKGKQRKGMEEYLYSAISVCHTNYKVLRHGSHSFTCKLHYVIRQLQVERRTEKFAGQRPTFYRCATQPP